MKSEFSEFSYGFAFTYELVNALPGISAAPLFPSLRAEAKLGYDVKLDYPGLPLFFQFKLSDRLVRSNALYWCIYGGPYYRFHITSLKTSKQHNVLKDLMLEDDDYEIFYTAPLFHTMDDFNRLYLANHVSNESIWIPLESVPYLDDDDFEDHCVTFSTDSDPAWHTDEQNLEGEKLEGNFSAESHYSRIQSRFERRDIPRMDREYFEELKGAILRILARNDVQVSDGFQNRMNQPDVNELIGDIRYLLTTYLSLEMVVFQNST